MDQFTCSVAEGNHSPGRLRSGMCGKHYRRLIKWGDPLYLPPKKKPVGNRTNHPRRSNSAKRDDAGRRICTKCSVAKDNADYPKDKNSSDGLRAQCKDCHAATQTARYPEIQGRVVEQRRAYRESNLARVREIDRERYIRHRESRMALALDARHARRAREASGVFESGITTKSLRDALGDQCYFCGVTMQFARTPRGTYVPSKATIEHLVPISRGGDHSRANCVLACHECNLSKGRKTEQEFSGGGERQ